MKQQTRFQLNLKNKKAIDMINKIPKGLRTRAVEYALVLLSKDKGNNIFLENFEDEEINSEKKESERIDIQRGKQNDEVVETLTTETTEPIIEWKA